MKRIIPALLTLILFSSCVGLPGPGRSEDAANEQSISNIEPISLEFYGLTSDEDGPSIDGNALEAMSAYLSSRLVDSPYYRIVLSEQERVLTGKIGRIGEKYQLSLNMIHYETSELENAVTVQFLSLTEFDYAIDLAVAKLEGRDIKIGSSAPAPRALELDFNTGTPELRLALPEVPAADGDADLRRIAGMLREQLAQGDYKLESGEYQEASRVYADFLNRYATGISSSYKERLEEIRLYAENQKVQSDALKMHEQWSGELKKFHDAFKEGEDPDELYVDVEKLKDTMDSTGEELMIDDAPFPFISDLNDLVEDFRVVVLTAAVESSIGHVHELLSGEAYFTAWEELDSSFGKLKDSGLEERLTDYTSDLELSLEELRLVCDGILDATEAEFLFNISYYGFNQDKEALTQTFRDYRRFLLNVPFEVRRKMSVYNSYVEDYAVSVPSININLIDIQSVLYLMRIFGYDIFDNPRNLAFVKDHPFDFPMTGASFCDYLDEVRDGLEYTGYFYSGLEKNEAELFDKVSAALDDPGKEEEISERLVNKVGKWRTDDIVYALEFDRLNIVDYIRQETGEESSFGEIDKNARIYDFEDVDRFLIFVESDRRQYRHRDNRNKYFPYYNWHKSWLSINSRFFDFFLELDLELKDEYGLPVYFGTRANRTYYGDGDFLPYTFVFIGRNGVEVTTVSPDCWGDYRDWTGAYLDGVNNRIVIYNTNYYSSVSRKEGAVIFDIGNPGFEYHDKLSKAQWQELVNMDLDHRSVTGR